MYSLWNSTVQSNTQRLRGRATLTPGRQTRTARNDQRNCVGVEMVLPARALPEIDVVHFCNFWASSASSKIDQKLKRRSVVQIGRESHEFGFVAEARQKLTVTSLRVRATRGNLCQCRVACIRAVRNDVYHREKDLMNALWSKSGLVAFRVWMNVSFPDVRYHVPDGGFPRRPTITVSSPSNSLILSGEFNGQGDMW